MKEKNLFEAIIHGMHEGILVTDSKGKIILTNPAVETMLCVRDGCIGKTPLECIRNLTIDTAIQAALTEGRSGEHDVQAFLNGKERYFVLHTSPLLEGGSVSVISDVTRIRKLENMRREFVANVSHELKTPLASIRGYAETLGNGAMNDPKAAPRFISKIMQNAIELETLVDDILKMTEVESGRFTPRLVPLSLREVTEEILAPYREEFCAKNFSFDVRIANDLVVEADARAFHKILRNLLDNAIKYTAGGGSIILEATRADHHCRISVGDTGIGIPASDIPHVFERFYRVDRSRSRTDKGTGLGLAIVKHLVQSMGGEVGVESESEKGSTFWFTVPKA